MCVYLYELRITREINKQIQITKEEQKKHTLVYIRGFMDGYNQKRTNKSELTNIAIKNASNRVWEIEVKQVSQ